MKYSRQSLVNFTVCCVSLFQRFNRIHICYISLRPNNNVNTLTIEPSQHLLFHLYITDTESTDETTTTTALIVVTVVNVLIITMSVATNIIIVVLLKNKRRKVCCVNLHCVALQVAIFSCLQVEGLVLLLHLSIRWRKVV